MPDHNDVAIVGAGPVGLIAAHELARRGVSLRLFDKRPGPSHTTRAFTLHARTMEMFEHIGVAHRIEEVALPCPGNVYHFQGMSEEDKPRTDFRGLPTRYPFYYKINQNDFEQVLREHLCAHYGIRPEYGQEFIDLEQDADGVTLSVVDRASGEVRTHRSAWVIGSDGAHSRVRDRVGIDFVGDRVGVMAMMDVEISDFAHDDAWVNYFIGESLFMLVTKLPGRLWRVYLSDAGAMTRADDPRGSFQAVADEIGIGMRIGDPQWATQWEILNSAATSYRAGRVFLCGDASHVHSPAGGQGMNGCMQDAFNLGWKLAAVVDGAAPESLLDTYEAERRPIGAQITAGARSTHDIVMAFGQGLADRIALTREPGWQQRTVELISGLSYNYRDTVSGPPVEPVPGPAAGDRAPDAQLVVQPRKRLFDLFRHCGFTLLLVPRPGDAGDAQRAARVAALMREAFGDRVSSVLVSADRSADFDEDHLIPDQLGSSPSATRSPRGGPGHPGPPGHVRRGTLPARGRRRARRAGGPVAGSSRGGARGGGLTTCRGRAAPRPAASSGRGATRRGGLSSSRRSLSWHRTKHAGRNLRAARSPRPGRPGRRVGAASALPRRFGELAEMAERVGEMVGGERRERDVLPDVLRDGRPVVGQRHPGLGRTGRREVVAPRPATELQLAALVLLPRPPADRAVLGEHLDPVGHLVVPVRVVRVVHPDSEDLSGPGQRRRVDRGLDPAGAVDGAVRGRIGQHGEHLAAGTGMVSSTRTFSSAMSACSSSSRPDRIRCGVVQEQTPGSTELIGPRRVRRAADRHGANAFSTWSA
ncbi:FAD-dependent oxidoreductase [Pseudonocardia benzenivorans]